MADIVVILLSAQTATKIFQIGHILVGKLVNIWLVLSKLPIFAMNEAQVEQEVELTLLEPPVVVVLLNLLLNSV